MQGTGGQRSWNPVVYDFSYDLLHFPVGNPVWPICLSSYRPYIVPALPITQVDPAHETYGKHLVKVSKILHAANNGVSS